MNNYRTIERGEKDFDFWKCQVKATWDGIQATWDL